ncbi:hypothetical protein [Streptomyces neyagawaensis]|uniref:hypothetical protein n=1 Tax=Streptomyces neyagawaensis TaxID=42238 RepID=UPI00201CD837|nr:hypothetical protein [Streptomyces neyagawaensis]MCL6733326.1 hypothetical protein [Streptomyces neyagawaensis]MDE1685129.1 hypothetical protein [Streptomyces neyagawaensis]
MTQLQLFPAPEPLEGAKTEAEVPTVRRRTRRTETVPISIDDYQPEHHTDPPGGNR